MKDLLIKSVPLFCIVSHHSVRLLAVCFVQARIATAVVLGWTCLNDRGSKQLSNCDGRLQEFRMQTRTIPPEFGGTCHRHGSIA